MSMADYGLNQRSSRELTTRMWGQSIIFNMNSNNFTMLNLDIDPVHVGFEASQVDSLLFKYDLYEKKDFEC